MIMQSKVMNATPQQEETYEKLMKLYDATEGIIDVVESGVLEDPEAHIPHVETLVHQVEESTETLAQIYIQYVETGKSLTNAEKRRAESALRKIGSAIEQFKKAEENLH